MGQLMFKKLFKVAKLTLVLLHSNTEKERVFSTAQKNKTTFLSSLSIEGTLSSILTVKLADANAVKFKLTNELLKKAKREKWDWNKLHLQMKCYKNYYFKVVFLYIFSISLPIFL